VKEAVPEKQEGKRIMPDGFGSTASVPALPRWRIWVLAARPKTLAAAVAPVLMGTAMAWADGGFHLPSALFALIGALLIQIGTNFANDYADYLKGADTATRKGPLRVTAAGLVTPEAMRRATALTFALAVVAGLYLIWRGGWPVLAIGLLSILFGILYTSGRYALAYLGLGELFVLIFFGPVAVGGTYYVQTLTITQEVLLMGLAPGLISTGILLVNNVRDIEEDRQAGKRTPVVRFGRAFGVGLYACCLLGALLLPVVWYLFTYRHGGAMAVLALLPASVRAIRTLALERDGAVLNALLAATGRLLLLYSLLFSIGWILT
jgi:1,4-dihydroxy-2-naphthoate octaprenyltransferase